MAGFTVRVQEHQGAGWESANVAYMCLRDHARTRTLRAAIRGAVTQGDTVLDIGSGTGILSLFAAEAGARTVYAIEGDGMLADALCRTVERNGYGAVIQVIHADARDVDIQEPIDVVISETLDTGLIGESLVPVHNAITSNCGVTPDTRFIPSAYETWLQPARRRDTLYGFHIYAPRHEWSFYRDAEWLDVGIDLLGENQVVWRQRLGPEPIEAVVETEVAMPDGADALLVNGRVELGDAGWFGDFPSMNGPKLVPIPDDCADRGCVEVTYLMGGGLESIDCRPRSC